MTDHLLEVTDLRMHYHSARGPIRAVDGVSFWLEPGEILGIAGESGSGKTATALTLMRLISPSAGRVVSGQIELAGRDLLQLDARTMRRVRGAQMSLIFQNPMTALNPVFSVGSQLREVLKEHLGLEGHAAEQRAIELLRSVEVPDPAQRLRAFPHQMSGGMLQRVMIALAVSCGPKVLIADEPTTALDVTIQAQILHLLRRMARDSGMGIVFITHNLAVLASIADRVAVMYAGKMVESGTVQAVFTDPQHPYTQGLLKSVPRLDMSRTDDLQPIPGSPPALLGAAVGCAFRPRCPYAIDHCRQEVPPLEILAPAHAAACWVAAASHDPASRRHPDPEERLYG